MDPDVVEIPPPLHQKQVSTFSFLLFFLNLFKLFSFGVLESIQTFDFY
jgi:hypothetical protein